MHIYIERESDDTVHDSRVLSKLIVANGLRWVVDELSFRCCVRGESNMNWSNRFVEWWEEEEDEEDGGDDRREFFIDDANLFKQSLHWSCERSCCNCRIYAITISINSSSERDSSFGIVGTSNASFWNSWPIS